MWSLVMMQKHSFGTVCQTLFGLCDSIARRNISGTMHSVFLDGFRLKLVTLDAMNTLIRLKKPPGETYAEFARGHNLYCDSAKLNAAFGHYYRKMSEEKPCFGYDKDGAIVWWWTVVKSCFLEVDMDSNVADCLARRLVEYYGTAEPWELVDSQIGTHLEELTRKDLHIGVISNSDSRLRSILDGLHLSGHIEMMFISGELGIEKPDRRIFERAACCFEIFDMNEMLHVGDDEENDYNGALGAGARALLLDRKKTCSTKRVIHSLAEIIERLH